MNRYKSEYKRCFEYVYEYGVKRICTLRGKKLNMFAAADISINDLILNVELRYWDNWAEVYKDLPGFSLIDINKARSKLEQKAIKDENQKFLSGFKNALNKTFLKLRKINGKKAPPYKFEVTNGHIRLTTNSESIKSLVKEFYKRIGSDLTLITNRAENYLKTELSSKTRECLVELHKQNIKMLNDVRNNILNNSLLSLTEKQICFQKVDDIAKKEEREIKKTEQEAKKAERKKAKAIKLQERLVKTQAELEKINKKEKNK